MTKAAPGDRPGASVHVLIVEVGRKPGDGLPEDSDGAAMLCYASGRDEEEAVRETIAVLRQAGLAPLEVTGYGSEAERAGEIDEEERSLMRRAREENAVIVAQVTPFRPGSG